MADSIHNKLKKNKQRITELGAMISVYADLKMNPEDYGKIQNLRDKLDFALLELEEAGQQAKIRSMEQVLDVMKNVKRSSIILP